MGDINWEMLLVYIPVDIGPWHIKCGIVQFTELKDTYALTVEKQRHSFTATDKNEAVKIGLTMLGEKLLERLNSFPGNPFVFPVIPINESEE